MKTSRFCELIEEAMAEEYAPSQFDTVPFLREGDGAAEPELCLGIFLTEGVHMAVVAARAQYLLWQGMNEFSGIGAPEEDIDEEMGDFCNIMTTMRVAPYMQWHCAYFPGLTAAQLFPTKEDAAIVDEPYTQAIEAIKGEQE